jgi:hypothetical protein
MFRRFSQCVFAATLLSGLSLLVSCGTTRSSDTSRTATEQLLISDAIDRAVQTVNVQSLAGQTVFLDDSHLGDVVDRNYLISTLRQHLLANGCNLRDKRENADFIVEARAGAIGTDRNDLLFGIPSMNVPQILPVQPVPAAIPEIPFAKRRDQRGIAKIAVFAYHRETGTPVWQSGVAHQESSSNDVWILGAGPFQRGTIHQGTEFAGKALGNDEESEGELSPQRLPPVDIARESVFTTPQRLAQQPPTTVPAEPTAVQADHQEPAPAVDPANATPIVAPSATPIDGGIAVRPRTEEKSSAISLPMPNSVYAPPATRKLPQPRYHPQ